MLVRMLVVGMLLGPTVASAKGIHAHGGGSFGSFGGVGTSHVGSPRLNNQRPAPIERWDTPVDQVPDWDQRETQAPQGRRR